ncbi:hypothetical protein [Kyrpidia tusciae]|nr:hypothetical protein [Kyrpidia tusciae]
MEGDKGQADSGLLDSFDQIFRQLLIPPVEVRVRPVSLYRRKIMLKSVEQSDILKAHRTRLLPGAVPPIPHSWEKGGEVAMSVFEALMIAINLAVLVVAIINTNRKDRP